MRISVVQMTPGHVKARNIAQAETLIDAAVASDRPDILVLPEVWTCLGGDAAAKQDAAEALPSGEATGGDAYEFLRRKARQHGVFIHGGSILEKTADKLFNTTIAFDRAGHELARYRKIHLFDIVTPDGAGYRESATYGAGEEVVTYQAEGVTIGCAICYDLRFAELFLALRRAGAELIMLPAAFTLQTGKDHWETLLRARAIETQCWIAAAGTSGCHLDGGKEPRFTYGHSLVCDPWGHVVAKASDGQNWATARLDPNLTQRVRRDMPVLEHRRLV